MHQEILENVYIALNHPVFRLILGDRMDSKNSLIEYPSPTAHGRNPATGTIGFCDFQIYVTKVPTLDHMKTNNTIECLILRILVVGVEPKYRGNKYSSQMAQIVKEFGISKGIKVAWHDSVSSTLLQNKWRREGLTQFYEHFIEYLN